MTREGQVVSTDKSYITSADDVNKILDVRCVLEDHPQWTGSGSVRHIILSKHFKYDIPSE